MVWKNVTLTLGLPEWMFQMAHLNVMENNSHIISKPIHNCKSYGRDKFRCMHRRTHAYTPNFNCDNNVSLTASGVYK